MSLRRLHHEQPESFAFTPANMEWAKGQIAKYPEGREASAVIPLLWRGQEQEGWVSRPMIEEVARILGMEQIRVLEVATFYFMFQLAPVGSVAHVQVCGTTSCMICGAEDLMAVCKEKIAKEPHQLSADGRFSWEEVECLGACANAPMAQIGKDYYEDLTQESFAEILDALARGEVPRPGSQTGRWASEPAGGVTSLFGEPDHGANASIEIAEALGDTIRRIDGSERTASDLALGRGARGETASPIGPAPREEPTEPPADADRVETERRSEEAIARPPVGEVTPEPAPEEKAVPDPEADQAPSDEDKPELLSEAPEGGADNLKKIKGIGPKLEKLLNEMGVYRLDQIAAWTDREVAWVDYHLEGFNGRIRRDEWVAQAQKLAAGEGED